MSYWTEITKTELIAFAWGSVGWLTLGLGIFGLSNPDPSSLHKIFENRAFSIALVVIGGFIAVAHVLVVLSERRRK